MKEILDKVSSYNLFNYLFPGTLLVYLMAGFTSINLIQQNLLEGIVLYYFTGMTVNRFGSLVVEPILLKIRFVKYESYNDFVKVSKEDEKLELLSEINNTYKTISAMFILLFLVKFLRHYQLRWCVTDKVAYTVVLFFVLLIYLFSYRKQSLFINKRISGK